MAVTATGTYVTAAGYRLLTKLLAAQGELNFTRAAVGTGKIPEGYSAEALTGLTQYKMDAEIASYGVESEKAYVTCQISSEKVSEGFLVTEVGVFATDPDEGEILYGYMDISGDPTYIYSNGSGSMAKFAEFQMYFLIGALQKVTAIITPGSYVSREALKAGLDTKVTADGGEAGLTVVDFDDSGTVSGITDFQSFLSKLKRGGKLGELIRNFRAGMKYVIHLGLLVNNCLSDRTDMALTAAQGKALQEQITQLNGNLRVYMSGTIRAEKHITFTKNVWSQYLSFSLPAGVYIIMGRIGYSKNKPLGVSIGTISGMPNSNLFINHSSEHAVQTVTGITNGGTYYLNGIYKDTNDADDIMVRLIAYPIKNS